MNHLRQKHIQGKTFCDPTKTFNQFSCNKRTWFAIGTSLFILLPVFQETSVPPEKEDLSNPCTCQLQAQVAHSTLVRVKDGLDKSHHKLLSAGSYSLSIASLRSYFPSSENNTEKYSQTHILVLFINTNYLMNAYSIL